ncbi:hypothetical protein LSH36_419g00006 [Paralvinella palmiformis]|uniref:Uncharacterized protein n=1 Tax=Paralvinella palmiformis TaxID=53620 RepID=A0AAD9MY67_9ANNE|nr:hypothetical protein LSH36_419g00006 [Paralvinella palmiformis]
MSSINRVTKSLWLALTRKSIVMIIPEHPDNLSDHLSISIDVPITLQVKDSSSVKSSRKPGTSNVTIPNWNNNPRNKSYQETTLKRLHADVVTYRTSLQADVDTQFTHSTMRCIQLIKKPGVYSTISTSQRHSYFLSLVGSEIGSASGCRYRTRMAVHVRALCTSAISVSKRLPVV